MYMSGPQKIYLLTSKNIKYDFRSSEINALVVHICA